jgi:hypothetical protein
MPTTAGAMTSHPFESGQFDPFNALTYDFVNYLEDGGPDRSLHPGVDFGPYVFCFNTSLSALVGDVVADVAAQVLKCPAHGLSIGDQVRFDSDGILPSGLFFAIYYFVVTVTTDTFKVSNTNGGPPAVMFDIGVGHHNVTKRGTPLDMTGWSVWAWVKTNPTDLDANKLLDLAPTLVTPASLGTVQIHVTGALSTALLSAKAFWDMIGADGVGNRLGALARGEFDIEQLVTHPA